MASNANQRKSHRNERQRIWNGSIGATLSRTTIQINGNHLRTLFDCLFSVYIVPIVRIRAQHMYLYLCICATAITFPLPLSSISHRFLGYSVCEWLVMPLRNRNFSAKSAQRKYLRKPIFNIRNLYSPFFFGSGKNQKKKKRHNRAFGAWWYLWWANRFLAVTQYLRTSLFTLNAFCDFHILHFHFRRQNMATRFRQINNLFRCQIFLHDLSIGVVCLCMHVSRIYLVLRLCEIAHARTNRMKST